MVGFTFSREANWLVGKFFLNEKGHKPRINGHCFHQTRRHNTKPIAFHYYSTRLCILSLGFYALRLFLPLLDLPSPRGTGARHTWRNSSLGALERSTLYEALPHDQLEPHPQCRGQVQHEEKDLQWREGALGKEHPSLHSLYTLLKIAARHREPLWPLECCSEQMMM